jgi:4-azaleucine resistance transporter AzlC
MIYGVLALGAGIPPLLAQAMSAIVFAGSAQFIGAQLIGAATPAGVILLTTLMVNLRHVLYSASLAPYLKHLSPAWKWILAYLLTDEAYAVTILNYRQRKDNAATRHWFLLGAGTTLWTCWQASTAVGIFLGTRIPASWALDFTLALTFIGLLVPAMRGRADVAAAGVAGIVAVAASSIPYQLGLLLAVIAGIGAGLLVETGSRKSRKAARSGDGSPSPRKDDE